MRAQLTVLIATLAALGLGAAGTAAPAASGPAAPTTCRAATWCTITADGVRTPLAAQFAIGNVTRGTTLAITQNDVKHQQVGGQIEDGVLAGTCAWSQYNTDWAPVLVAPATGCAAPLYLNSQFIAHGGTAIWSGCYPRCFGGVPLHFDTRCGKKGRTFCYSSNCEEFGNFYPWTPDAHPTNPLRGTRRHRLEIRYLARYGDVWTNSPFYMVKDPSIGHGRGNWVFVSGRACNIQTGPVGTYRHMPRHY